MTFYIVDVFAERKYAGNQLAVVRGAKSLSATQMQEIAKEMSYSETTFMLSEEERDGGYDVRIFTPENELPFAGHPTLGTAYVIQRELIKKRVEKIVLNLKVGRIPVTFSYGGEAPDLLWMQQMQPTFGRRVTPEVISEVLGLKNESVDQRFPVEEVSTGVPVIITPLETIDSLRGAKLDRDRYFRLIKDTEAKSILVFSPETRSRENDLSVRFFAEYYGVPEDPATGSANGCLAAYLVKHRYFEKDQINVRVEQGYEIGRPSLLLLRAEDREEGIDVHVGGKVIMVARGGLV